MNLDCTVIAGHTNDKTGIFSPVSTQHNMVMYQGADIIAALLSGDQSAALSHMYFHYSNDGDTTPTVPTLDRTMGGSWFYDYVTGVDYYDWLRVPIITAPRLFRSPSNSSNYTANGIYLTATAAASESMHGESPQGNEFGSGAVPSPSIVFAAALVSAANPSFPSQDKIFSRVNLVTPLTTVAGSQPTIFWSVSIS